MWRNWQTLKLVLIRAVKDHQHLFEKGGTTFVVENKGGPFYFN